jgi:hypothetical protein
MGNPARPPDVLIENHGTIFLVRPLSGVARAWVEEHIGQGNGYQPCWPTVVVEPRYLDDIIEGMRADGLAVSL